MNKKVLIGIGVVIAIGAIGLIAWYMNKQKKSVIPLNAKPLPLPSGVIKLKKDLPAYAYENTNNQSFISAGQDIKVLQSPVQFRVGNDENVFIGSKVAHGNNIYFIVNDDLL